MIRLKPCFSNELSILIADIARVDLEALSKEYLLAFLKGFFTGSFRTLYVKLIVCKIRNSF